ncbi:helix-turn-helix transcriptional regulator [Phenylobacterium sp.]|uniref:helix-turn-helix transcriptional regulator n=1 Tax=Phenylobacterium sp. TaxID=1871053 RepID=UPI00374D743F
MMLAYPCSKIIVSRLAGTDLGLFDRPPNGTRALAQIAEDHLVEQIYAAALDASRWPGLLEAVADAIGAGNGVMTRLDSETALGESLPFRCDEAVLRTYAEYYHEKNVFTRVDDLSAWRRGWRPSVVSTADLMPVEDYYRSEYFNDFMRLQDAGATLHIRLELDETTSSAIAFGKPIRQGEFERWSFDAARRLQPHLIRAYRLTRSLVDALGPERDLAKAVEASNQAIFLVDGGCVVRHANPAAVRLLAADKGLTVLCGRLMARNSDSARRLESLVAEATSSDAAPTGGAMKLPLPGQRFPLAIRVAPIPRAQIPLFGYVPTALVCLTDLETEVRSPESELRALFGLTYAEAKVATAIFQGLTMREAAALLGVALNTVRFQLARVYEKTGATRQAELVKLMMRLSSTPA